MGISFYIAILVAVIVAATIFVPITLLVVNPNRFTKPYNITWIALGLLITHWVFYLAMGYTLVPAEIVDLIFLPVWAVLSIFGVITSLVEFNNNKFISLPVLGLSMISILFSLLITGISKM